MRQSFGSPRLLLVALVLCAPSAARAQSVDTAALFRLRPGDSVRVWSRSPGSLVRVEAALRWHRTDSLALSTGTVLPIAEVARLQVRRRVAARSAPRIVGGSVLGLVTGAAIGGVIGFGASGGFDGRDEGYGDGMGVIVGVPVGAVLGTILGASMGSRRQLRPRWMDVSPTP